MYRKFLFWDLCDNVVAVDNVSENTVISDIAHIRKVTYVDNDGDVTHGRNIVGKVTILYMDEKSNTGGFVEYTLEGKVVPELIIGT